MALREDERRGQDWLGPELGVPPRTVSRIPRRHQVAYLCELVHMDVKRIGRIPDGGGWRATAAPTACHQPDGRVQLGGAASLAVFALSHQPTHQRQHLGFHGVHPIA